MSVFRQRLRLPTFFNGAGLIGVDRIAPAAFIASVAAAAEADTILTNHIAGLERFALPALHLLQARLAPLGPAKVDALLHLPLEVPVDLFNHSRYVEQTDDESAEHKKQAPKLQWKWSREVHAAAALTLLPLEQALGDCDLVHAECRSCWTCHCPIPSFASLQLILSAGFAFSSESRSWLASVMPTRRASSSASRGASGGTWTCMATTRTPASAGPPCTAAASATAP